MPMAVLRIFSYLPNPRVWKATIAARLLGVEVEVLGDRPKTLPGWLWDFDARPLEEAEKTPDNPHARASKRGFGAAMLYKTDAFLAAHPFGTVPAAFDPEGATGVFESNSILRAVARAAAFERRQTEEFAALGAAALERRQTEELAALGAAALERRQTEELAAFGAAALERRQTEELAALGAAALERRQTEELAAFGAAADGLYGEGPYEAARIDSFLDAGLVFARETQAYLLKLAAREATRELSDRMREAYDFYMDGIDNAARLGGEGLAGPFSIADIAFVCDFAQFRREERMADRLADCGLEPIYRPGGHPRAHAHFDRLRRLSAFAADLDGYVLETESPERKRA